MIIVSPKPPSLAPYSIVLIASAHPSGDSAGYKPLVMIKKIPAPKATKAIPQPDGYL
jgi:hypothetical protein